VEEITSAYISGGSCGITAERAKGRWWFELLVDYFSGGYVKSLLKEVH